MIFPNDWNGFYPQKSRKSLKDGIPNIRDISVCANTLIPLWYGLRKRTANFSSGGLFYFHFPVLYKFIVGLETFFPQFSVAEPLNSVFKFKKFRYAYVWLRSFIATIRQEAIDCIIRGLRMEETVASPKKTINGCCAFSDECKCRMFRCKCRMLYFFELDANSILNRCYVIIFNADILR